MRYLLEGAPIYTMNQNEDVAEAMIIEKGMIMAVGDRKDLAAQVPDARRISLDGGSVIPAFNDCHAHLLVLGQDLTRCDLKGCITLEQVQQALIAWQGQHPDEPWVMGWNFDGAR